MIAYRYAPKLSKGGTALRNKWGQILTNPAFLAAEAGTSVDMLHLIKAARREFGKLEKSVQESELRNWI